MATTIKSTDLDFDTIKNNLKIFLAQSPEFSDYNFEASGLSSILDVLAYNTHYNALTANFALNESFLSTAQLRSSVVNLASGLGYSVGSRTASCAVVNMYVVNSLVPESMTLPAGFKFTSTINNKSYTFKTRDTLIATNNGSNQYYFQLGENQNVTLYEGVEQRKIFIAGPANENETYVLPTTNLDLDTVQVRVYADTSTTVYTTYTAIKNVVNINKDSTIFVVKETPNGQYELTFGNGARLGKFPKVGNKIEVLYDQVAGPDANGGRTFTPVNTIFDAANNALTLNVVTVVGSMSGQLKEPIASIRKNAPYLYATQNRMVTAADYSSLVKRKFSNVITDVQSWGGEDNIPPEYGSVFLSILFNTDNLDTQTETKNSIIDIAKNLSVASFNVKFLDPVSTYLELQTRFQWNPNLTGLTQTAIEKLVTSATEKYFNDELTGFDESFRKSNLLTIIDDTDPSILSSRTDVVMQNRFIPESGVVSYSIKFPTSIAIPDDINYIINSSIFDIPNSTKKAFLRNRLKSSIIEVVDVQTGTNLFDNVGEYDSVSGVLTLSNFTGTLSGNNGYIKITAVPSNQSTLNAVRNNLITFDATASTSTAIITDTL